MSGTSPSSPASAPAAVSRSASASTARVVRSLRRSRMERRTVYAIIGVILATWLFVVFANALADASDANARLAVEQRVNASLSAQAAAGAVEIERIRDETFLEFLSRSYGMGEPVEHPFALAPGAPAPAAMTPLGGGDSDSPATTPLDDWLDLLIGS